MSPGDDTLQRLFGGAPSDLSGTRGRAVDGTRVVEVEPLSPRAFRVELDGRRAESVIAKALGDDEATTVESVLSGWLPELGLGDLAPRLYATVEGQDTKLQFFEVLDGTPLSARVDRSGVQAAATALARLHTTAAASARTRRWAGPVADRGDGYVARWLDAAAAAAQACGHAALQDVLADRYAEVASEGGALDRAGGPVTLLHGDPWPQNIVVTAGPSCKARLVDWDRAGVGRAAYDITTLLLRLPSDARGWAYEAYRSEVVDAEVPSPKTLGVLARHFEVGRLSELTWWALQPAGAVDAGPNGELVEELVSWLAAPPDLQVEAVLP